MSAYVNVHGQPLAVSARDAVRVVFPDSLARVTKMLKPPMWQVLKAAHHSAALIGTGANEESAWRDAWSRVLAESVEREGRAA
jgi:membrane protein required for beta-lactamase induction